MTSKLKIIAVLALVLGVAAYLAEDDNPLDKSLGITQLPPTASVQSRPEEYSMGSIEKRR